MNPFLIIGIAIGAFLIGRKSERDGYKVPRLSPGDFPDPRALPPAPGLEPTVGDAASFGVGPYMAAWQTLPFTCEIYPAGADYTFVKPPVDQSKVSTTSDCGIVAVPKAWWDKAGAIVKDEHDAGVTTVVELRRRLLEREAPRCLNSTTDGSRAFGAEIYERIVEAFPGTGAKPISFDMKKNGLRARNGGNRWTRAKRARPIRSR